MLHQKNTFVKYVQDQGWNVLLVNRNLKSGDGQLQGRETQRAVSAHIPAIIGLERCCRTLLTFVNKLGEEQIQNAVLGSIPEHGPDKAAPRAQVASGG